MEHPSLIYMIQREIQNDRMREASAQRQMRRYAAIHPFRRIIARFLITTGSRIAATPQPAATRPAIGGVALAGRTEP